MNSSPCPLMETREKLIYFCTTENSIFLILQTKIFQLTATAFYSFKLILVMADREASFVIISKQNFDRAKCDIYYNGIIMFFNVFVFYLQIGHIKWFLYI